MSHISQMTMESGKVLIPDKKKSAQNREKESIENVIFQVIQGGYHLL